MLHVKVQFECTEICTDAFYAHLDHVAICQIFALRVAAVMLNVFLMFIPG